MLRSCFLIAAVLATTAGASAQDSQGGQGGGTKADAERSLQAYLAMWSSNDGVTARAVERFYAPRVIYYGKSFSRAAVLADKKAYVRAWPVRSYREVPGTFKASCNGDRSLCHVTAQMTWRRVSSKGEVSKGRARLGFDFVPADGGRKIARESARVIESERG